MSTTRSPREIIDTIRAQLHELEDALEPSSEPSQPPAVFDPDTDTPEVAPVVYGSRTQRDWCSVMFWAQLRALNVRQARGATHDESVEIAERAGYQDGRGWNRWTGWDKDDEDNRWITDVGMEHLRNYYQAVNRSLPSDFV